MANYIGIRNLAGLLAVLTILSTWMVGHQASAQGSIFRDRRDVEPIIPTIVPPEGPVVPGEEGEAGLTGEPGEGEAMEGEASGTGEETETGSGAPLAAMPVSSRVVETEHALNRKRDEASNVSSPGILALLREAGQLEKLRVTVEQPPSAPESAEDSGEDSPSNESSEEEKLASTFMTQVDARTFTFSIPAPRGQILDRKGKPLAQTKVVNYAAIKFPHFGEEPEDARLLKFSAERIHYVNKMLGTQWDLQPDDIREHYINRRWMPLLFSGPLTKDESERLGKAKVEGLELVPVYLRHYPNETLLSHALGYVGKRPPRSTGVIGSNEPIWGAGIGVQGLELAYDKHLTGEPGKVSELYDGEGNLIRKDVLAVPRPGHNVITTIDLEMQRIAERLLRDMTHRGALVVMDCNTGDVVAMASYPQFNPNDFIPSISSEKYKELLEDEEKPLFPRAYKAAYPPASTFKVATALSFLETGYITPRDSFPCPPSFALGDLIMRNWNDSSEGYLNVVTAIARSCNTWFFEIGINVGADSMSSMAFRLGLGEKTGLPLPENAGFIPNNRYWVDKYGYQLSDGDEANMSIGQGRVKCTPVQVARMMGTIGNQENLYKARLVKQVQDVNHNVVEFYPPEIVKSLSVGTYSIAAVRKGMNEVVNASYGTGKVANHPVTVSAKTGTGQWITSENRNIAWFAGYFPSKHPVYSFSVVYEGNPGEKVGGGAKAAPIIRAFLDEYLTPANLAEVRRKSAELGGDYTGSLTSRGSYYDDISDEIPSTYGGSSGSIFRNEGEASVMNEPQASPVQAPRQTRPIDSNNNSQRRRTFFNRLFGR